eukprot:52427-Amphidinium_carterae.1
MAVATCILPSGQNTSLFGNMQKGGFRERKLLLLCHTKVRWSFKLNVAVLLPVGVSSVHRAEA